MVEILSVLYLLEINIKIIMDVNKKEIKMNKHIIAFIVCLSTTIASASYVTVINKKNGHNGHDFNIESAWGEWQNIDAEYCDEGTPLRVLLIMVLSSNKMQFVIKSNKDKQNQEILKHVFLIPIKRLLLLAHI